MADPFQKLHDRIADPNTPPEERAVLQRYLEQGPAKFGADMEGPPAPTVNFEPGTPQAPAVNFEGGPVTPPVADSAGAELYRKTYRGAAKVLAPSSELILQALEKYAPNVLRGFEAGASAPLRYVGANVTPPEEQTLPVRLAEAGGSLGTILGTGAVVGGAVPALAETTILPRTLHSAITLGLVEGGATEPGGNPLKSFAHGALIGAPYGALFAPGLSLVQRALVGAGLSATFGGPAPLTGTKEEEILLGTLLGLLGGGGPKPEEKPLPVPGEIPKPEFKKPIQGELFPQTTYAAPGTQFELPGVKEVLQQFTLPKMPLPTTAEIGVQEFLPLEKEQLNLPFPKPQPTFEELAAKTAPSKAEDLPLTAFGAKDPDGVRRFAAGLVAQSPSAFDVSLMMPNPAGHSRLLIELPYSIDGSRASIERYFNKRLVQLKNIVPDDISNYDVFFMKTGINKMPINIVARPAGTDSFVQLTPDDVETVGQLPRISLIEKSKGDITIHPIVPPPVIVSEDGQGRLIFEGYHGTIKPNFTGFKEGYRTYVGTYKAALDRAHALTEGTNGVERIVPVRVELEKVYGTSLAPASDGDANDLSLIQRLKKEGYDGILHRNAVEDQSSLSLLVFNPKDSIKIVGQQILPGMSVESYKVGEYYKSHHLQDILYQAFSAKIPEDVPGHQLTAMHDIITPGAMHLLNLDNAVYESAKQLELPGFETTQEKSAFENLLKQADSPVTSVPTSFDKIGQTNSGLATLTVDQYGITKLTLPDGTVFTATKPENIPTMVEDFTAHLMGNKPVDADTFIDKFQEGWELYKSEPVPSHVAYDKALKFALDIENPTPEQINNALKTVAGQVGQLPDKLQGNTPIQSPKQLLLNLGLTPEQMQLPLVEAAAKTDGFKVSVLPTGYSLEDFQKQVKYFDNLGDVAKAIAAGGNQPPDITPPGIPPIGGPAGSHPEKPEPGDIPPTPVTDINLGILPLTRWLLPLKPWVEAVENRSKGLIPAYKVWKLISRGQLEWLKAELPNIEKGKAIIAKLGVDRGRASYYYLGAQSEAERAHAVSTFGITPEEIKTMNEFREQYDDLFVQLAIAKFAPYEKDYVPLRGKNSTQVDQAYPKNAKPTGFDFWADHFRRGDISVKEDDLFKLYFQYVRAGTKSRYFEPFYAQAKDLIDGLTGAGAHTTPGISAVYSRLQLFMDEARNLPDQMKRDIVSSTDNILRKLGVNANSRDVGNVTDFFLTVNAGANMAFRYSLVLRNYAQSLLITPYTGFKYWWIGLREAMTEGGKAEATKAGLNFEPAFPYETETLSRFGKIGAFARQGTAAYRHADEVNRATAYLAAKRLATAEGLKYQQGKISLDQFIRNTNLDLYHPIEKLEVLSEIKRGNIEAGADLLGQHLHQNTQWIYLRGNEPQMFSGTVGRLLGQYGTWPTWYLSYLTRLGSQGSPTARIGAVTRLVATYAAIEYTAHALFGSDYAKWLYFGPLNYGGGPFLDLVKNFHSLIVGSDQDKKVAAARLAAFPAQLIPGSGVVRELKKATEQPDLQKSVFTMLGFPPENPYESVTVDFEGANK